MNFGRMELAFLRLSGVRVGVGGGASLCVHLQSTRLGLNALVGAVNYAHVPNQCLLLTTQRLGAKGPHLCLHSPPLSTTNTWDFW